MFAKEAFLGVRPANKVNYYVIASPAGAYFKGGVAPVSIWLSTELRARRQGRHGRGQDRRQLRGDRCCPSRRPTRTAAPRCCSSTQRRQYLEELGGMNVVFVYKDGTLVTPAVRRRSSRASRATRSCSSRRTAATRSSSVAVTHRRVARGRRVRRHRRGVRLRHRRGRHADRRAQGRRTSTIGTPNAPAGELTMSLREELTDIQYGRRPDRTAG